MHTLFTIDFGGAINFGENIFGGFNYGDISISAEIRPLKIFGVKNFCGWALLLHRNLT